VQDRLRPERFGLGSAPQESILFCGSFVEKACFRAARPTDRATAAYGRCMLATRNVVERVSDSRRQLLAIPAPMLALLVDQDPGIEARRV